MNQRTGQWSHPTCLGSFDKYVSEVVVDEATSPKRGGRVALSTTTVVYRTMFSGIGLRVVLTQAGSLCHFLHYPRSLRK